MNVRSLAALTGVTALGLVMGACSSSPGEKTGNSGDNLLSATGDTGGGIDIGNPVSPTITTTRTGTTLGGERGDPTGGKGGKGGKSTCKAIEVAGAFAFKDPILGWIKLGGNTRLGALDMKNGTVPCVGVDTWDQVAIDAGSTAVGPAMCKFFPDEQDSSPFDPKTGSGRSGAFLKDTKGQIHVPIGQRVELNGAAVGRYVTGTVPQLQADGTRTTGCIPAGGYDAEGTPAPAGTDLAATCMVEVGGTSSNFGGMLLQNVATLRVCTTTPPPHPDAATYVGAGTVAGTHCYTDMGAAVNDSTGQRDGTGTYFGMDWSCHLVDSGGIQVPGGKRISTKSYPPPGAANTKSPIKWLVVNSYVSIAN